jgi:hypothetical protein
LIDLSGIFHPEDWLRFVQLSPFSRKWDQLGLDDDDLRALEVSIMAKPDLGPVVRGAGGVRKARFASHRFRKGKSGAYRVYYIYFEEYSTVLLITIFAKNEMSDLSDAGKKAIAAVILECKELLERGGL